MKHDPTVQEIPGIMKSLMKPYVHLAIDAVDTVIHDPHGRLEGGRLDRFSTYDEARDAALSCVELMLDEGDYDDEEHRDELTVMLNLLESAESLDELASRREYQRFLDRLELAQVGAV